METFEMMKAAQDFAPEIRWGFWDKRLGVVVSVLMVCKSAAGYYPGRMCFDPLGFVEPYSRDYTAGYFDNPKAVEDYIDDVPF